MIQSLITGFLLAVSFSTAFADTPMQPFATSVQIMGLAPTGTSFKALVFYHAPKELNPDSKLCIFKEDDLRINGSAQILTLASSATDATHYVLQIPTGGLRGKCVYTVDEAFYDVNKDGQLLESLSLITADHAKKEADETQGLLTYTTLKDQKLIYCDFARSQEGLCESPTTFWIDFNLAQVIHLDFKDMSEKPPEDPWNLGQ